MNFDIGYHVISQETLNENDGNAFNTQMSIVEFLRRVKYMDDIPYDVTVYGLDELLRSVDDPEMMSQYIHDVLAERVNFLLNKNPIVQFVVDNIELWDEPVIPDDNDDIPLGQIFNYSLEQEGAGWYYARLNVTS